MAEAEFLCNKLGILIQGAFVCFGSLQHLKEKYGSGYRLQIKTNEIIQVNETILKNFNNIKKLQDAQPGYLNYEIPSKDFSFYKTFQFLEEDLKKNNLIEDFSITQCSLEQIFLYFSKLQQFGRGEEL